MIKKLKVTMSLLTLLWGFILISFIVTTTQSVNIWLEQQFLGQKCLLSNSVNKETLVKLYFIAFRFGGCG